MNNPICPISILLIQYMTAYTTKATLAAQANTAFPHAHAARQGRCQRDKQHWQADIHALLRIGTAEFIVHEVKHLP